MPSKKRKNLATDTNDKEQKQHKRLRGGGLQADKKNPPTEQGAVVNLIEEEATPISLEKNNVDSRNNPIEEKKSEKKPYKTQEKNPLSSDPPDKTITLKEAIQEICSSLLEYEFPEDKETGSCVAILRQHIRPGGSELKRDSKSVGIDSALLKENSFSAVAHVLKSGSSLESFLPPPKKPSDDPSKELPNVSFEKRAKEIACLFELAANQGNADAQLGLAYCYKTGFGIEPNWQKWVQWLSSAAKKGNFVAHIELGNCYSLGHGLAQDYEKALRWYDLALKQINLNIYSGKKVSIFLAVIEILSKVKCSPLPASKIASVVEQAIQILKLFLPKIETLGRSGKDIKATSAPSIHDNDRALLLERVSSLSSIATQAPTGEISTRAVINQCIRTLFELPVQNDSEAQYAVAHLFRTFNLPDQSLKWLKLAAGKAHPRARIELGDHYLNLSQSSIHNSTQVANYYGMASKLYQQAKSHDGLAFTKLGNLYFAQGRYAQAAEKYALAAGGGDIAGLLQLAACYNQGLGVEQNQQLAQRLYRLAKDQGCQLSEQEISYQSVGNNSNTHSDSSALSFSSSISGLPKFLSLSDNKLPLSSAESSTSLSSISSLDSSNPPFTPDQLTDLNTLDIPTWDPSFLESIRSNPKFISTQYANCYLAIKNNFNDFTRLAAYQRLCQSIPGLIASEAITMDIEADLEIFGLDLTSTQLNLHEAYQKMWKEEVARGEEPPVENKEAYERLRLLGRFRLDITTRMVANDAYIQVFNAAENQANPKKDAENESARIAAKQYGLTLHNVDDKGNCLFDAISKQLEFHYKVTISADHLRIIAMLQMQSNPELYSHSLTIGSDFSFKHLEPATLDRIKNSWEMNTAIKEIKDQNPDLAGKSEKVIYNFCRQSSKMSTIAAATIFQYIGPLLNSKDKVEAHANSMLENVFRSEKKLSGKDQNLRKWGDGIDLMALLDALRINGIVCQTSGQISTKSTDAKNFTVSSSSSSVLNRGLNVPTTLHYYNQLNKSQPLVISFNGKFHYQSLQGNSTQIHSAAELTTPISRVGQVLQPLSKSQLENLAAQPLNKVASVFNRIVMSDAKNISVGSSSASTSGQMGSSYNKQGTWTSFFVPPSSTPLSSPHATTPLISSQSVPSQSTTPLTFDHASSSLQSQVISPSDSSTISSTESSSVSDRSSTRL